MCQKSSVRGILALLGHTIKCSLVFGKLWMILPSAILEAGKLIVHNVATFGHEARHLSECSWPKEWIIALEEAEVVAEGVLGESAMKE